MSSLSLLWLKTFKSSKTLHWITLVRSNPLLLQNSLLKFPASHLMIMVSPQADKYPISFHSTFFHLFICIHSFYKEHLYYHLRLKRLSFWLIAKNRSLLKLVPSKGAVLKKHWGPSFVMELWIPRVWMHGALPAIAHPGYAPPGEGVEFCPRVLQATDCELQDLSSLESSFKMRTGWGLAPFCTCHHVDV